MRYDRGPVAPQLRDVRTKGTPLSCSANQQDIGQRAKIAAWDNSTQALKTNAENARKQAKQFEAQIADSNARTKTAEAQISSAMAASADAVAKVAAADARSAEASAKAEGFRLDIAKANESAAPGSSGTSQDTRTNGGPGVDGGTE